MPQNPNISNDWKKSLGDNYLEIHDKYLHKLGNLTLTEYNQELSDSSFKKKQNMPKGFKLSSLSLNKCLAELNDWNKDKIIQRAKILANLSLKIWSYPQIDKETLINYVPPKSGNPTNPYDSYPYMDLQHNLFNALEEKVLNLGADVKRNLTQSYIAFKTKINIVYIYPQKDGLQLELLMPMGMLKDPENKVNVRSKVHYNDRVSHFYKIYSANDIDYAVSLIKQVYDYSKNMVGFKYPKDSYADLFNSLETQILDISPNVKKNKTKSYISFKTQKNFVYIHPLNDGLSIVLSMPVGFLKDPENKVKVLSKSDSKGPVDHVFKLSDINDLDYVMGLIKQSYEYRESKYPKKIITLNSYKFLHYHTDLFNSLNKEIKSLGNDVNRELTNDFITYKNLTNFVDITPQKSALRITINMPFDEVDDPKNIGEDGTGKNLWEHGAFYFKINSQDDLGYVMGLIKQSYDYRESKNHK